MKIYLKICENPNCWEIIWAFPKKKCQFCWSLDFSTHHIQMRIVLWWYSAYADIDRWMWILRNYKWVDHLFIRTKKWESEWNDCDHNWWYIHIIDIDDIDYMEELINKKIARIWEYLDNKKNHIATVS